MNTPYSAFDSIAAHVGADPDWNPVEMRRLPAFSDLPAIDLPTRFGGANSVAETAEVFRRCGMIDLELRDLPGAGHARFLTLAPTRSFDGVLGDVASGDAFAAIAITEPNVGSDLHAMEARAEASSGGYTLTGVKQHISRVEECTHFIVFATIERPNSDRRLVSAFLVPADAPGLTVERMRPMGMARVSWGRVILDNVEVPASQRIGGEGQGLSLFVRHFSYWRVMMSAAAIGSAQAAVEAAIDRMKQRNAFGGPIGRFTHLQQGLAEHVGKLRMAWLLVREVAGDFDRRRWPIFDAAMAKAEALEAAIGATDWALRTAGASGYDTDNGFEKRYRDLLGLRVADGTTDVLRGQVARSILGESLYELSLNRPDTGQRHTDARRRYW